VTLLAYLALVVAVAAVCCGHQGEPFPIPLRGAWRALRRLGSPSRGSAVAGTLLEPSGGRVAARETTAAPRRALNAPQAAELRSSGLGAAEPAQRRSRTRSHPATPTWARTDTEEAA